MSETLKTIKLWGNAGPNPPKVAMILAELGLPYEAIAMELADVKKPKFLAINPNGRMPAIYDPNTDITLWESAAIVEYLVETYDKDHKISFPRGSKESFHTKQWLFFQATGQAPYYGQAAWFKKYHAEKLPSAIERYLKEIHRVTGVLETVLSRNKENMDAGSDGPWLVGNRMSYADIAHICWQNGLPRIFDKDEYNPDDFPVVKDWLERMTSRPAIKAALT